MKIFVLITAAFCALHFTSKAQLYSSGNNNIAGNSVGIGISNPNSNTSLHIKRSTNGGNLLLENSNSTGFQTFRIINDVPSNFATYTKYGSAFPGGYTGVSTLYPFANIFGFGNNGPMFNASTGNMGFAITKNSTNYLKIHIDANTLRIGLGGTAIPAASIHVNNNYTSDTIKITNSVTGHNAGDGLDIMNSGNEAYIYNRENGGLTFGTNNATRMVIASDGKVSIGNTTTPTGYKLFVEQGILTEKVKVAIKTSANWSDYVFADEYQLKPLQEVAQYINANKHLPGIPSADEVVAEGIDIASMDAKLLEKIEELTLYIIKMEKEIQSLKIKTAVLESTINIK